MLSSSDLTKQLIFQLMRALAIKLDKLEPAVKDTVLGWDTVRVKVSFGQPGAPNGESTVPQLMRSIINYLH